MPNRTLRCPELRLFVAGASGLGHQASSLLVLESILAEPESGGLGYRGRVTIVYEGGAVTRRKLSQLLPVLAGVRTEVRIGTGTVNFVPAERVGTLATAPLGLTGGADRRRRFTALTGTRTFLRLQPYRWADMWASCLDELQLDGNNTERSVPLTSLPGLGPRFSERCFYVPVPGSPWLNQKRPPARRDLVVTTLLEAAAAGRVRIWPIYGIRSTANSMLRRPVADMMFTLAYAALAYQDLSPGPPVVILLLDRIDPHAPERPFARLRTLLAGGPTQSEELERHSADTERVAFARQIGGASRVRVSSSLAAADSTGNPHWPEQVQAPVHVVNVGPVSTALFRQTFATAGLPPVFEGATTASLALSVGRPYLHVARVHRFPGQPDRGPTTLYPAAHVQHLDALALARCCQQAANQVTERLESWPATNNPAERLAAFLAAVEAGSRHELAGYFDAVATAYGDPSHDRLRLGLAAIGPYA